MNQKIINYLMNRYEPTAIMVYGSYANHTNNDASDFDALLISEKQCDCHDGSIVDNVPLDVFIYNPSVLNEPVDCSRLIQVSDALILLDRRKQAEFLKNRVHAYLENTPPKTASEKQHLVEWCKKMLLRAKKPDSEGYYRWHWLLTDSLEIYYSLKDQFYFGPKKAIMELERTNAKAYQLYNRALTTMDYHALTDWIDYIVTM